jgi:hypothetical protein
MRTWAYIGISLPYTTTGGVHLPYPQGAAPGPNHQPQAVRV